LTPTQRKHFPEVAFRRFPAVPLSGLNADHHGEFLSSYELYRVVFTEKCNNVFDLMVNYSSQGLKWAA
jgi:hypothetical protein